MIILLLDSLNMFWLPKRNRVHSFEYPQPIRQLLNFLYFSNKGWTSLRICTDSTEPSLLVKSIQSIEHNEDLYQI